MKANQLRTIILQKAAVTDIQTAMDKLRNGSALTAGESGTVAYDAIADLELVGSPFPVWDGVKYTVLIFVSAG